MLESLNTLVLPLFSYSIVVALKQQTSISFLYKKLAVVFFYFRRLLLPISSSLGEQGILEI